MPQRGQIDHTVSIYRQTVPTLISLEHRIVFYRRNDNWMPTRRLEGQIVRLCATAGKDHPVGSNTYKDCDFRTCIFDELTMAPAKGVHRRRVTHLLHYIGHRINNCLPHRRRCIVIEVDGSVHLSLCIQF